MQYKIQDLLWKTASSSIKEADGTVIFEMNNIEVPEHWSQSAINILAQKYFRKAGVPSRTEVIVESDYDIRLCPSVPHKDATYSSETSAKQVFHRLAGAWTYWGLKQKHIQTSNAMEFYETTYCMLAKQEFAPNSPQWFNTGLNWAYGITGPAQGHYYGNLSPKGPLVLKSEDAFTHPQASACFIQGIEDRLIGDGGIMDTCSKEALLFKYGSGSGTNFSNLRGSGESLSGGGISSGLMSFLKIGDVSAGSIKSGGTTRRAAKMVIVDTDHPDIEEFVNWKTNEENKVASLAAGSSLIWHHFHQLTEAHGTDDYGQAVKNALESTVPNELIERAVLQLNQGINPFIKEMGVDWQSEAYQTVSGQNSNNTVRMSDKFISHALDNQLWDLINRTDGKVAKTISASSLLDQIAKAAWSSADPGIHYQDVIQEWHTCKESGEIRASNPCSEYLFLDDTACNLASLNLVKFVKKDGTFDYERFFKTSQHVQTILDITVGMAQYPTKEIAIGSMNFRTTGIGVANLGGLLMRWGIPYDSEEGRFVGSTINSVMTGAAYLKSTELAKTLGTFPQYEKNKESMMQVILKHFNASNNLDIVTKGQCLPIPMATVTQMGDIEFYQNALWKKVVEEGYKHGFRNAQTSVAAPTGTIGFVMDCDTTGIEPSFSLLAYKSLAGGGGMTIVNECVYDCLISLGYHDKDAQDITALLKSGKSLNEINHIQTLKPNTKEALACASDISVMGHLKMLSVCQQFLSGSLSKTINMPAETTVNEIKSLIYAGRDLGLKALAIYRDKSKLSQPLMSGSKVKEVLDSYKLIETKPVINGSRLHLPNFRNGHTVKFSVAGMKLYLRTGEYEDGSLGEIFINVQKEGEILSAVMNSFAISTSLGLQYGVPLEEFVEANVRTKFEPSGIVQGHDNIKMCSSIMDAMFKHLAIHYLKRYDLAQIKPATSDEFEVTTQIVIPDNAEKVFGEICTICKSDNMVRAGTCMYCKNCGESTGCS